MNPQYYGAAAEYNKPAGGGFKLNSRVFVLLGIIVGVLIAIAVAFNVLSSISQAPRGDYTTLIAREGGLQQLIQKQQNQIRSADLRKVNSETNLLLLTDLRTLNAGYSDAYGALPEDGVAPEVDSTDETTLKSATQSGNFDTTYAGLLRDKIASTYQQAEKVHNSLGAGKAKEAVKTIMENLAVIDKRLKDLGL